MSGRVLITIVTHNSERWLKPSLESLRSQTWPERVIRLWDNASEDRSLDIARGFADLLDSIHGSDRNLGFCAAQNRLIASETTEFVLALNPDVVLEPSFVATLVEALEEDPRAGSATGKLWRWRPGSSPEENPGRTSSPAILDTTGIYFTRNQRHLDRGSGEPDRGQYEARQYVFGASGAAACYRREMLEDAREGDEYFDESFFAYREDADLAWRAQWLGWRCLYVPEARGWHVRRVLPERRSSLPAAINLHSFKNRFLLRVKNMDAGTYARLFLPITARDAAAVGYVLFREWSSLRAFPLLAGTIARAWALRRSLRRRRRVTPREMREWFSDRPVARKAGIIHPRDAKDAEVQ